MDLDLPGITGLEAIRRIAKVSPESVVLVLSMLDDDESVLAAMRAGARGYVLKGAGQEELLAAIRAVAAGGAVFGAAVAGRMLATLDRPGPPTRTQFPELTDREAEVLSLMAEGRDNRSIAAELGVSAKTVANHVSHVLDEAAGTGPGGGGAAGAGRELRCSGAAPRLVTCRATWPVTATPTATATTSQSALPPGTSVTTAKPSASEISVNPRWSR